MEEAKTQKKKLRFKHMFGEDLKEEKYIEVKPSAVGTDNHLVVGNSLYVAFQWATSGGGSLRVMKNGTFGR